MKRNSLFSACLAPPAINLFACLFLIFCVCSLLNKPTVPENGTHHTAAVTKARLDDYYNLLDWKRHILLILSPAFPDVWLVIPRVPSFVVPDPMRSTVYYYCVVEIVQ